MKMNLHVSSLKIPLDKKMKIKMKRTINLHVSSLKIPLDKKAKLKLKKLGICFRDTLVPLKSEREKVNLFLSKKGHCLPFVKITNCNKNFSKKKIIEVTNLTSTKNAKSQKKTTSKARKISTASKEKKQITKARVKKAREEKTAKVKLPKPTAKSQKMIQSKTKPEQDKKEKLAEQQALRAKRMEMREKKRSEAHWPVWDTLEKKKSNGKKKLSQPKVQVTANNKADSDYHMSDSGESSDEDEKTSKTIPNWAKGEEFNDAMKKQSGMLLDLNLLFDQFNMPELSEMFTEQRKRFKKRNSTALWNFPPGKF